MNPALLLCLGGNFKKQVYFVGVVLVIILCLPVMAVFALGQHTLSFLSDQSSDVSATSISTTTVGLYQGPLVSGDSYAWGNCTYWVYALRLKAGNPIPTTWGNAATWAPRAAFDGYIVDHNPSPGSIMQTPYVADGLGHVAYVTNVDPITGAWTISEMNVKGLDIIDLTTYTAPAALNFNFIHDKQL